MSKGPQPSLILPAPSSPLSTYTLVRQESVIMPVWQAAGNHFTG